MGPGTAHQFGRRGAGWPRLRRPGGRGLAGAAGAPARGRCQRARVYIRGEEAQPAADTMVLGGLSRGGRCDRRPGRPGAAAEPEAGAASPGGCGARACRGGRVSRGAAVAERAGARAAGRVPGLPAPHSLVRGDRRGSGSLRHAFLIQAAAVVTSPDGQRPATAPAVPSGVPATRHGYRKRAAAHARGELHHDPLSPGGSPARSRWSTRARPRSPAVGVVALPGDTISAGRTPSSPRSGRSVHDPRTVRPVRHSG